MQLIIMRRQQMMHIQVITLIIPFGLLATCAIAQPGNDDCSNAQSLCPNVSIQGSTVSATTQCNGPDGDCLSSGSWGQCYDVNNSVWYTFTTNSNGGNVSITVSNISCFNTSGDNELQGVLLAVGTPCDAATYTSLDCHTGNANSFTLSATALSPNTTYWLHIDGDNSPPPQAECNFNVSIKGQAVNWIVNTSSTSPVCYGGSNGTATATPQSGVSPYTYLWDAATGNQSTQTATGLSSGTYSITITDNAGCDTTVQISITNPPPITANPISVNANCGNADGSASLSPNGGATPYTYQWDGNAGNQTTQTATGLQAGSYQVTVTDGNGCTTTATVLVNNTGGPNIITDSTMVTCPEGNDGTASVYPSGGATPYSYQWDANTGNQTNQTATGLGSGTFIITVTDNNGCISMASVTVTDPPPWNVIASSTPAHCQNADGTAGVTPTGATPPYTYQWDISANSQTTSVASGLASGTYSVTITDANLCDTIVTINVSQTPGINSIETNSVDASCSADDGSVFISGINGGTGPYQYSINGTTYQSSNIFGNLPAGTYTVYVKDDNGCTATSTATVNQPDQPLPDPTVKNKDCNSLGSISIAVTAGTAPYTFSINGSNAQTGNTFTGLAPGSYIITVTDANGCENTVSVSVSDECEKPPMLAATGFSPNGDGKNDFWSIANTQYYENCKITVFDRWGQKVFSQTGYENKWDGRSMGYPVPDATYYYLIWLDKDDKSQGFIYGYVAIVR